LGLESQDQTNSQGLLLLLAAFNAVLGNFLGIPTANRHSIRVDLGDIFDAPESSSISPSNISNNHS
jgi:hypothetical protein